VARKGRSKPRRNAHARSTQHSPKSIILPFHRRRRTQTLESARLFRMWIVTALFKPLAYVSVPYLILKYATDTNPIARYYFRVFAYYSALGICSIWGIIVAVGMSLAGHRLDINWVVARSFYTLAGKLLDIKFIVEGEEHLDTKPSVLVGNHQSGLDILFLGRWVPSRLFPSHPPRHAKLIYRPYSFPFCCAGPPNCRVIQDFPEACVYHGQEGACVGSVVGRIPHGIGRGLR
jgi:hypothetical protein